MSSIFTEKKDYSKILAKMKEKFQEKYSDNKKSKFGDLSDYEQLAIVGSGSFGTVKLCRDNRTKENYAIKILLKANIIKNHQVNHIHSEKRILQSVDFPLMVNLEFSLKDNDCLYLGLPFINGGEMFSYLRKCQNFDENKARFYAAQICLALEYLQYLNLVYRDLKPENILLDNRGYVKLTDFGFCKLIDGRTWTLCGTPEYIAPELILMKGYGKSVDWWSYGIFIYEMVAGVSPFFSSSDDPMTLFAKIVDCKYKMPTTFSYDLRNLIFNLLQVDTTRRYGNLKRGSQDIKNHNWFKGINWISFLKGEVEAPYVPKTRGLDDFTNFDKFPDLKYSPSKTAQYEREFQNF